MISLTTRAAARPLRKLRRRDLRLRGWRTAAGLTCAAAGAAIITGALLPWVETFGGLIGIPGIRGGNGRILAAAGAVIAAAGIYYLVRGGQAARWLAGLAGFAALGFSGYLLIQLTRSMNVLGGDSMVIARGGPGLWVAGAGSAVAFATLFFPPASQATLRRPEARGTALAWAADRESTGARRGLQIALGVVWLLDAALQYQPYMFGKGFVTQVLAPATMGNPALIASPALAAARLIGHDVAAWNALFATTQLALAAGLLWRRTAKAALAGTIAWSLVVWWLGEGLGGVLTGTATPLTGAPGAAVLYAILAVLAWPARPGRHPDGSVAGGSPLGRRWARLTWLTLWGSSAYLVLRAPSRSPRALHDLLSGLAGAEPGWIASAGRAAAAAAGSHGLLISAAIAAIFVLIGAGVLCRRTTRLALALAAIAALVIWVAGENFGGIFTGQGTDPNTGPLLILLAAAFWPWGTTRTEPSAITPQAGARHGTRPAAALTGIPVIAGTSAGHGPAERTGGSAGRGRRDAA